MEIDIRKEKEDEVIESIRYGVGERVLTHLNNQECYIETDNIQMEDVDNLILALKKYKELYGWNEL